jgi:hypothetical protein
MKRAKFIAGGCAALVAVIAAAVVALAGGASGATPPAPPSVSSGTPALRTSLSAADQATLARIGATGAITQVGSIGGTAFYAIEGTDGGHCYAFGSATRGGLSGGCMPADAQVPAVIDMSGVVMNPTDGSWKLDTLQGIAADGIAEVGFVDASGVLHTTAVVGNVYRLAGQAFTGGSSSLFVGMDGNGNRVFTVGLGTS